MIGEGIESTPIIDAAFWVIAVSSIVAAIAVVQLRDLFRAALFLVVSFLGVAGMFVLLRAEFLAAVQVLIYVGAISVLIIFAILMTRDVEEGSPSNRLRLPVGIIAGLFLAAAVYVIVDTEWMVLGSAVSGEAAEAFRYAPLSAVSEAGRCILQHHPGHRQAADQRLRAGVRGGLGAAAGRDHRRVGPGQGRVTR